MAGEIELLPTRDLTYRLGHDVDGFAARSPVDVYFRKPGNLRKWQAALAKVRAGLGRARVVFIGDSKTVGNGAGTSSANTWSTAAEPRSKIAHVVRQLNAAGIPANRQAWFGTNAFASPAIKIAYDPRLSGLANWTGGNATLGGNFFATNLTNSLTFTPEGQCDTLETYYKQRSGDGTFTINADGGATLATLSGNSPTDGYLKNTVTVAKGAHAFNIQRTGGSFVSIGGMLTYDSAVPAIDVINGGAFGTVSSFHTSGNGSWAAANVLLVILPDLVIIQLGSNDLNTNVDVATYTANILDIITKAKAAGADVVLEIATFANVGGYGTDEQREAYRQALIRLGSTYGCVVVDHAARFVSFSNANAIGLMRDAIHETEPGYADEAQALVSALLF
ncbi:SGNH/GDSL hydrolase family protein [Bosea sp. ASV33]|uniref:SGNH/GDSL hydrolase family protein n=1 Tax=Bosea sp. ASV33 TaxID=2795106 RepID=UPI0018EDBE47|nr:SGNH/GDSL hydrolase family protein [Bosea sp. ASV33]